MMSEIDIGTTQRMTETHRTTTTFLDLLRRQMSGHDLTRRKRTLKERLRFKCIGGCCGPTWSLPLTNNADLQSPSDEIEEQIETGLVPESGTGMNLATALEAERYNRGESTEAEVNMTPTRVSLMRLLEETAERAADDGGKETEILTASMGTLTGNDSVCCVCMGRKKGAAFIPCGHTFCRVCSRELWLNRGSCPLCNRPIIEILDIF
ncbi:hypothetical protein CARUB_v10005744mg [Capsella rubella]|uniref:RING-type domain-containing protein n=1 Tax=Capsella rubella TaxID=81985 RepID=R0GKQ3_9BRAS|nr:death-associated inhibitor of apoptosis 1 [Capsella rubella]EOA17439.1 hypothetical protein CARUB_v10005744mg [Capsella rubella]